MIKITGIDHIKMEVCDVLATVAFYQKAFGFEILEGTEMNPTIIGNEKVKLCIHQGKSNILHFGFHVENYSEIEKICDKIGIENTGEINWPLSDSQYIIDPDGRDIELSRIWGGGLK